jgi:hypothetical protein
MGYATVTEVDQVLAQALTSARPDSTNQKINLINVGETRDPNRIATDIVERYIVFADAEIDAILSEMYEVPLHKCAQGQWPLDADINEYNQIVEVTDSTNLVSGNEIIIRDDSTGEAGQYEVETIIDQYSFTVVGDISMNFSGDNVRVIRIGFPPPIHQASARYAASFIYDKYFAAQSAPNVSDYGKEMRRTAMNQLNNILNGKTILREPCARRIGDRFGNAYLDDSYAHRDRGYKTSERNMSNA